MRNIAIISFALVTATSTAVFADDADDSTPVAHAHGDKAFGVDGAFVLPVGAYGNSATVGIGALARLEIPQGPGFITARAGVIVHSMNDAYSSANASLTMIPLYGGYRYPIASNGVYLAGELGLTYARVSVSTAYGQMSGSDLRLGLTAGVGMKRGSLDLRASIFAPSLGDSAGLMANVGWDFAKF